MQDDDFADVEAPCNVIVQVADGNSTNRNLISFRFVAFWVKCPSDSVTYKQNVKSAQCEALNLTGSRSYFPSSTFAVVRTTTVLSSDAYATDFYPLFGKSSVSVTVSVFTLKHPRKMDWIEDIYMCASDVRALARRHHSDLMEPFKYRTMKTKTTMSMSAKTTKFLNWLSCAGVGVALTISIWIYNGKILNLAQLITVSRPHVFVWMWGSVGLGMQFKIGFYLTVDSDLV